MLDATNPTLLERTRSSIRDTGHGWTMRSAVEVLLAHEGGEQWDIEVAFGETEAIIAWLDTHEHVFSDEPWDGDRPWATVVVDVVAAALRGEYQIERIHRGDRLIATRIVDVSDPERPRIVSTTGSLLGLVPWPKKRRTEPEALDYGVDDA